LRSPNLFLEFASPIGLLLLYSSWSRLKKNKHVLKCLKIISTSFQIALFIYLIKRINNLFGLFVVLIFWRNGFPSRYLFRAVASLWLQKGQAIFMEGLKNLNVKVKGSLLEI
jgi:hypothetical protein